MAPRFAGVPVAAQAKPRFAGVPADQAAAPAPQNPYLADLPIPGGGPGYVEPGAEPAPEYQPSMVPALDRVNAFANSAVDAIPVVGPALTSIGNNVDAAFASMIEGKPVTADDRAAINAGERSEFPIESTAGTVAGTVVPLMAAGATGLGAKALGTTGTLAQRVGAGVLSGGAIAGADAAARGAAPDQVGTSIVTGAAAGGAFPLAAKAASGIWSGVKGALAGAVSGGVDSAASQAMKSVATDLFQSSEAAKVSITKEAYDRFLTEVGTDLTKLRVNGVLDPKAAGVLAELTKAGEEIAASGKIDLGQVHILRQIAQAAAQSTEGRDQMLNSVVINKLDDFLTKLAPTDIAGAKDPQAAVGALQSAIENWHIAKKTSIIEEAMYRAQNQASGMENGTRAQFRAILNNPNKRSNFTPEELTQIESVANGTLAANALRLVGRFGFSGTGSPNALGGAMGMLGGMQATGGNALATAGIVAGASAARKGAEVLTARGAQNALSMISGQGGNALSPRAVVGNALTQLNHSPANAFGVTPASAALAMDRYQ